MRSWQWDIFCKVIDNFGDIGVCWRLAANLAAKGQRVRLWVDDGSALAWMASGDRAGVQVLPWVEPLDVACLQTSPCDVLIEGFGCEVAPDFIAACARIKGSTGLNDVKEPIWINFEYLSAESYVARNHGLSSLISSGPAAGWQKVFYYPGFTPETGGLMREPDLFLCQAAFNRAAWLKQLSIDWQGETLVSLFCYEPAALAQLLNDWARNGLKNQPVRLLVAAGRATDAVKGLRIPEKSYQIGLQTKRHGGKKLLISYLPFLSQTEFDHLLWASDINFVRGEDSVVRAIWAGKPFVWQLYPQDGGAHGPKLAAFLEMLAAPPSLRAFHQVWNGLSNSALASLTELEDWQHTAAINRSRLARLPDLVTNLVEYAAKNR